MKKAIAMALCAVLFALAAGGALAQTAGVATPTPEAPATATPAPQETENAATDGAAAPDGMQENRAYGEQILLEADQDGFAAEIAYPSGFEEVDTALETWANALLKEYEKKSAGEPADGEGMKAQLNVAYSSYELGSRYVGVKELGLYAAKASDTVESIVHTVNFDSDKTKILKLSDVIAPAHTDAVAALLAEKLKESGSLDLLGNAKAVAAKDMENFVITDGGVEFLFHDGKTGYGEVLLDYDTIGEYLSLYDTEQAADATPTPGEKPAGTEDADCTASGVQVRASADEKGKILAVLQKGAVVPVVKRDAGNGFSEIWYEGQTGYVWTAHLHFSDSVPASGDLPQAVAIGYVTGDKVHVRAEATTRSKALGTLDYDAVVKILTANYTDNWHQILYKDRIAYVSARYVSIGREPAATPKPGIAEPEIIAGPPHIEFVGTCDTNGVIIRSKTSIKSDYYGKLYNGDQVQVVESEYRSGWNRVWIPVNNANTRGYIGYVHSKYIDDWSAVTPVVQVTSNPVVPVLTPVPIITSNDTPWQIGTGVTVNP